MLRRKFIQQTGTVMTGTLLADSLLAATPPKAKKKVAMVGTGIRGTRCGAPNLLKNFLKQFSLWAYATRIREGLRQQNE